MTSPGQLFIGLMSGTSMDGVDGVLCRIGVCAQDFQVLEHAHRPFDDALQTAFMALQRPGDNELHRAALAGNQLALAYADVVQDLLHASGVAAAEVQAIGAHGQTVRHQPGLHDGIGYTLQINQPALLAERSGISVVADFRSRDVAAGGQGAPLVPPFHRFLFGRPDEAVAVVNIGGISNLTVLHADGRTMGFDCGPGNALMDGWIERHRQQRYDAGGAWAATGRLRPALLERLLSEPYFRLLPPKSTGRDLFAADWLEQHLSADDRLAPPADIQATLTMLTARCIAQDVRCHGPDARRLLVCGGGAFNGELMRGLQQALPDQAVLSTEAAGLPPLQVEAAAFAWLAARHLGHQTANNPAVTGAQGLRILGACHPA